MVDPVPKHPSSSGRGDDGGSPSESGTAQLNNCRSPGLSLRAETVNCSGWWEGYPEEVKTIVDFMLDNFSQDFSPNP